MYKKVELPENGFVGMEQAVAKNWEEKNIIKKNIPVKSKQPKQCFLEPHIIIIK